jgi:hypothetical protein
MKHERIRVSISTMMILALLTAYAVSNANKPGAPQAVIASAALEGSQPVVQNRKERQLVLLFQALLQMDRKDGLSISKEQAAALLPLIRSSRDQGDLTADQQKQALELLSSAQQAFYNELAAKMKNRMNGGGAGRDFNHLTQEERDKLIEQFQQRRDRQPAGSESAGNRGEGDGLPGQGFGKSMEQQLMDLLESKAKLN